MTIPTERLSILSNASRADLRLEPYPHLVIENALDPAVFAALQATFPADEVVVNGRPLRDTWYDYPACRVVQDERIAPIWREFFRHHTSADFFRELVAVAGDALRQLNPELEARIGRPLQDFRVGMRPGGRGDPLAPGADVSMECQFYANYTRAPRIVRGPHVDRPSELFAALLYFRQPDDTSSGADLEICEATHDIYPDKDSIRISHLPAEVDQKLVKTVRTARYAANTLVLFLNSPRSLHSVSPRTSTELTRRHINFCCDVPFDLFQIKLPPRLALKKRMERVPVAWRMAKYL
jgi:hypothetical protein